MLEGPVGETHIALAKKLKIEGRDVQEVAEFLGVSRRTLNLWKHQYPAFGEAFREIKQVIVARAFDKLNAVAMGGIKTRSVVTIESDAKPTKRITTEGETLPDTRALTHLLAVMDPSKYALNRIYNNSRGEDDDASLARTARDMEALLSMTPRDNMIGLLKLTPREAREYEANRLDREPDPGPDPSKN